MDSSSLIVKGPSSRAEAIDAIRKLDLSRPWEVQITQYYERHSDAQRRRYRKLVEKIADYTGQSSSYIHEHCKIEFLGLEVVRVGGKVVERPKSTTGLNKRQYMEFMEQVEMWAHSYFGIEL
jgi:hypothetical protein